MATPYWFQYFAGMIVLAVDKNRAFKLDGWRWRLEFRSFLGGFGVGSN